MVQAHRDHWIPVFRKGLSSRLAREEIGRKFGSQRTLQACTPCTAYAALRETAIGTELPTSAPQRFRPQSGVQLTLAARGRQDRS